MDVAKSSLIDQITTWFSDLFSSTFGDLSSYKILMISNSPLVLLFVLRLNRLVVPFAMRFFRQRSRVWINRVPTDIAEELQRHPDKRVVNYDTFSSSSEQFKEWQEHQDSPPQEEQQYYYQLRVLQEEHNRVNSRAILLFPDSIARYYTFIALVVACLLICLANFAFFTFSLFDKLSFTFGLFFTGVTAESDVLFPTQSEHVPHWIQKIAKRFSIDHVKQNKV